VKEHIFLCQLYAHTYMHIHIFSLLATVFSNDESFSVWLSGKTRVLTLPVLKSALTVSLLMQTRTDSCFLLIFISFLSLSHGKKGYTGKRIHPGKIKFSLKRQPRSNVFLNTTRHSHALANADLPVFFYFHCCYCFSHSFSLFIKC